MLGNKCRGLEQDDSIHDFEIPSPKIQIPNPKKKETNIFLM
jgi:hypothetical protein